MELDVDLASPNANLDSGQTESATSGCHTPARPPKNLHDACASGDLHAAQFAVVQGADVGRPDALGWRPLHHAAAAGHAPLVRWLLSMGARVDGRSRAPRTLTGATALHVAVVAGAESVVTALLRHGADPNLLDEAGFSPLHTAAMTGQVGVVRALLKAGARAEPYLADDTPLDLARRGGHRAVVGLLRQVARRPRIR